MDFIERENEVITGIFEICSIVYEEFTDLGIIWSFSIIFQPSISVSIGSSKAESGTSSASDILRRDSNTENEICECYAQNYLINSEPY